MQQRLHDGLACSRAAEPRRLAATDGPPSLAEVLVMRNREARHARGDELAAEVQRSVAALVLATGVGSTEP
jgi:hypothetical protein